MFEIDGFEVVSVTIMLEYLLPIFSYRFCGCVWSCTIRISANTSLRVPNILLKLQYLEWITLHLNSICMFFAPWLGGRGGGGYDDDGKIYKFHIGEYYPYTISKHFYVQHSIKGNQDWVCNGRLRMNSQRGYVRVQRLNIWIYNAKIVAKYSDIPCLYILYIHIHKYRTS